MICHTTIRPRGFSLIELLVVILIISMLLTLGAVGMKGITGGKGVSSGVAVAEALFDEARSIAVGKGTKARVLIDVDDTQNIDNYLRRMVVAYQKLDNDGEPTQDWELSSRASLLPDKTFFSREFSRLDHEGGGGEVREMNLTTGRTNFDGRYLYYEFNSEGICTTPGASFIIGTGTRTEGQEPRVTGEGKRDFGGFVVWRSGRTSIFRDPDQMGVTSTVTTF